MPSTAYISRCHYVNFQRVLSSRALTINYRDRVWRYFDRSSLDFIFAPMRDAFLRRAYAFSASLRYRTIFI